MPRPSRNQKAARNKERAENGQIIKASVALEEFDVEELVQQQTPEVDDWELLGLSIDAITSVAAALPLVWTEAAGKGLRGVYTKDSRTTLWRKKTEMKKAISISQKLTSLGFARLPGASAGLSSNTAASQDPEEEEDNSLQRLESAFRKLGKSIAPQAASTSTISRMQTYDLCKLQAVHRYFYYLLNGHKKMDASDRSAKDLWIVPSSNYRAHAIRQWANEYLEFGYVSQYHRGKHAKRTSLLADEDVTEMVRSLITQQKAERRNLVDILKYVNEEAIPEVLGVPGAIGQSTLWRYMLEWGYKYSRATKDVYVDGHERPDVVQYREQWAIRMMEYSKRMEIYSGEEKEVIVEPSLLPGQRKLVLVTHDESTFYANDGKSTIWLGEGESILRNKTPGQSIMISEFQCACHGTMRIGARTSRVFFYAGAGREGYWTHKEMLKQLTEDAIPIFEELHPGFVAVFIFDQSSNHNAYADDALLVQRMCKSEKRCEPRDKYVFRPGYFNYQGESGEHRIPQSMYMEKQENLLKRKRGVTILTADKQYIRYFKGIEGILAERALWLQEDPYRAGKTWRVDCKGDAADDFKCCARHLLGAQSDFLEQRTAIHEAVEKAGHIFELYPKFHCECNWIERYWGTAKRIARVNCDYSFAKLKANLPMFLDQVSPANSTPTMIRRFYDRSWRYIAAYAEKLPADEAAQIVEKFSTRQYKSHRRIGVYDWPSLQLPNKGIGNTPGQLLE